MLSFGISANNSHDVDRNWLIDEMRNDATASNAVETECVPDVQIIDSLLSQAPDCK